MNREELDKLTLEQLKAEATRYGLPIIRDKRRMVEAILDHLERNAPVAEFLMGTASEQTPPGIERQEISETGSGETQGTPTTMQQMMAALQQQQLQIEQLMKALLPQGNRGGFAVANGTRAASDASPNGANMPGSAASFEAEIRPTANWVPNGAVQALATQIPEFAG